MCFIISKIFAFLIKPVFWILLLLLASLFFRKKREKLIIISICIYWFFGNAFIVDLAYRLKTSFEEENIGNAFKTELSKLLTEIKFDEVPSNYSTFYKNNLISNDDIVKKIKYNSKILHQSKILKYFSNESNISKTEKEINEYLKKIKKNKKYVFTTQDIIIIESLKSDGVKIENKYYDNLYENNPDIPTDIQVKINNEEIGMILLRIVEIIGEDDLEDLGSESLNFIISVLNELNMDKIRNRIILKVLPLKV